MNKSDIKFLVYFVIIMLYICFMCFVFLRKDNSIFESSIIVDGVKYYSFDGKWSRLNNFDDFKWKKINLYDNKNKFINQYYFNEVDGRIYYFDESNDSHSINSEYIGIISKKDKLLNDFSDSKLNDYDYKIINSTLKSKGIEYSGEFFYQYKYITDINNDNRDDSIYIVSNEFGNDDSFCIVFARVNNKVHLISLEKGYDVKSYELGWNLVISKNNFNSIILKYYSFEEYTYDLFVYNDSEYVVIR